MSDNLNPEELLQEFSQEQSSTEDPEIEVKGKKYKASQIEEFEKGYMRQQDATKKWQEAAEMRKQSEATQQELQQYRQALQMLQQRDPYFVAQAQRILQGQATAPNDQYADDPYMQAIRGLQQNLGNMWNWQQELATKQNLQELDKELTALERTYPKMDRDKVLAAIAANPEVDTEEVARISHEEMTQRVRRELQDMAEQRKLQKRAMVEGSGGRTAGITKPAEIPKTREAMEKAVTERLRILGGI
jgi:hypothetical protein